MADGQRPGGWFLKWLAVFVLACGPARLAVAATTGGEGALSSRVDSRVSQIEKKFGLEICWRDACFPSEAKVQMKAAEADDYPVLEKYLALLSAELGKYPPEFFQKSRISKIVLAKQQFYGERPVEGLYQRPAQFIVLDFKRQKGNVSAQQHHLHHELFHAMEAQTPFYWGPDRWESFNPKEFHYSPEASRPRQKEKNALNYFAPPTPGFVSDYAMTSPQEDRAETFACLMVRPQNKLVHRWAQKDPILNQKIQGIKDFIREFEIEIKGDSHF